MPSVLSLFQDLRGHQEPTWTTRARLTDWEIFGREGVFDEDSSAGDGSLELKRFPEGREGRCGAVVSGGLVYAVATDPVCADGITAQTRNTLQDIERMLTNAGSDKSGLVQATVYLSDIALKPEMDAVWGEWVGPEENWPQRACIGVQLEAGYLIEVVVTATLL